MAEIKMSKSTLATIMVLVIIALSASSFWGGMTYQKFKQKSMFAGSPMGQMGERQGIGANGQTRQGASMISGEIISRDDKSITIKDKNGSSKIILLAESTEVGKFVSGTATDLAVGDSVMVNGKTNSDKSVTATSVQIRPADSAMNPGEPPTEAAGMIPETK